MNRQEAKFAKNGSSLARLSAAQRIVLRGIALGKKPAAIVDDFPAEYRIHERGICWHRREIYRKLGLTSNVEAAVFAAKAGLV